MKKIISLLTIFSFLVACQQTEIISTPTSTMTPLAISTATRVPIIYDTAYSIERGVMIFAFHYKGDKNDYNAFQVFISLPSYQTDKIAGYKIQTIDADYMLENDRLYHYNGSGEDWSWELVELPVLYKNEDNFASWKVYEDTYLGTWNEFTFISQVVDKHWNTIFTTDVFSVMYTH